MLCLQGTCCFPTCEHLSVPIFPHLLQPPSCTFHNCWMLVQRLTWYEFPLENSLIIFEPTQTVPSSIDQSIIYTVFTRILSSELKVCSRYVHALGMADSALLQLSSKSVITVSHNPYFKSQTLTLHFLRLPPENAIPYSIWLDKGFLPNLWTALAELMGDLLQGCIS